MRLRYGGVMAPEIMPSDPRLRRIAAISVVILIAAGFVFMHYALPQYLDYLRALARRDPDALALEYRRAFLTMFSVIGVLSIAIGVYLLHIGRAVLQSGRFPPPQVKVIVDTKIIRGAWARRFGWLMSVSAVLLMFVGVSGSALMYYKSTEMLTSALAVR